MSTQQKLFFTLIGTAIIFTGVNPANAVSISSPITPITINRGNYTSTSNGVFSNVDGVKTIDFEKGATDSNGIASFSSQKNQINTSAAVTTSVSGVVSGFKDNVYAAPAGDQSRYLAVEPGDSVTINFSKELDYFGLYWGSVDTYNSIAFYEGNNLLKSFSGSDVPKSNASGNQTNQPDNTYVDFFAAKGQTFNKIVLTSTQPAFETDNYAYRVAGTVVPESSSMLGLVAVGAIGTVSVLKRKLTPML